MNAIPQRVRRAEPELSPTSAASSVCTETEIKQQLEALNAALLKIYGDREPAWKRIPLDGPSDYEPGCFQDENAEHRLTKRELL